MTDEKTSVYFIGAGPGAPGYLTLDGKEALAHCRVVYALDPYPETFAPFLVDKEIRNPLAFRFREITGDVKEALAHGDVAFLVPGDMAVFSPFLPVLEHFEARARVIAGVGTMNAAAALLKKALEMPGISPSVVLTSPKRFEGEGGQEEFSRLARAADTMVLFMVNRPLQQLSMELSVRFPPETPVAVVLRVGLEGERIYRATLGTMAEAVGGQDILGLRSGDPSLALLIVGDVLEARSDPGLWDRRKERFWDRKGKGERQNREEGRKKEEGKY